MAMWFCACADLQKRGDELFAILQQFDDDFIATVEARDNEPPQEREVL